MQGQRHVSPNISIVVKCTRTHGGDTNVIKQSHDASIVRCVCKTTQLFIMHQKGHTDAAEHMVAFNVIILSSLGGSSICNAMDEPKVVLLLT